MSRTYFPASVALLAALLLSSCSGGFWPWYYERRADQFFRAGELESAKIDYLNLLRADRGNDEAVARLGLIWATEGAPLQAYGYLKKAVESGAQDAAVQVSLARTLLQLGDRKGARAEAELILEKSPPQSDAVLLLAETVQDEAQVRDTQERVAQWDDGQRACFSLARAVLARRTNDSAALERELQQACAREPHAARPHLAMAEFLVQRGEAAAALTEFKRAAELAPARSEERIKCAEYEIANGDSASARTILNAITKEAPDYVPAWTMLARAALSEGKYDDALTLVDEALARDAYAIDAHLLRTEIHAAKGEPARSVEEMERLDGFFPGVPLIRYRLARALLQNNNLLRAQAVLKETVINNPHYTDAILLLADTNTRLGHGELAIGSLRDLLSDQPQLPEARALLIDAYESRGYWDEAALLLQEEISATPEVAELYTRLGVDLRRDGQIEAGRAAFEHALRIAPASYGALDELVAMQLAAGQIDAAQKYVDEQHRAQPESAAVATVQAKIYLAQKDAAKAEVAAVQALVFQPGFVPAADLLAALYLAQGKLEPAVAQLEVVLRQMPRNLQALLTLAQAQDKLGRYADARDSYEKLLALAPDTPLAMNNLAFLYAEQLQQLDRAAELAWRARSLRPDDGAIADTLGWVLYRQGDYQQATRILEQSAAKKPDDAATQLHLGLAQYMCGDAAAAIGPLQIAAQSEDEKVRNEARARLDLIQREPGSAPLTADELEKRLARDSNDVMARLQLGALREKENAFAKAEEQYRAALKTNPKLLPALIKLAQLYAASPAKNCSAALDLATQARGLKPYDATIAGQLGRVVYTCGNYEWASSLLDECVRAGTSDVGVLTDYAWAVYSTGKVAEAVEAMKMALAKGANAAQGASAQFVEMLSAEDDSATAEATLAAARQKLVEQPDYVPALMLLARANTARGQAAEAAQIYSGVIERWPAFALAQKRLAQILLADPNSRGKAFDLLARARRGLPNDPEVAQLLAELSYERKDFGYAAQLLNESASKRPLTPKLLYYLAMCYWETKQPYATKENLQRALTNGLQEPFAAEAQSLLAHLSN